MQNDLSEATRSWQGIEPQRADFRLIDTEELSTGKAGTEVRYLYEVALGLDPSDVERMARGLAEGDVPGEVQSSSLQWQWTAPGRHEVIGIKVTYLPREVPFATTVYGMDRAEWDRYGLDDCPERCNHGAGTQCHADREGITAMERYAEDGWLRAAEAGYPGYDFDPNDPASTGR